LVGRMTITVVVIQGIGRAGRPGGAGLIRALVRKQGLNLGAGSRDCSGSGTFVAESDGPLGGVALVCDGLR